MWVPVAVWEPCELLYTNSTHRANLTLNLSHCMHYNAAWWCNGQGVRIAISRSRFWFRAISLSGNNLGQVVRTHVPLSPSSKFCTGQEAVMPCGWEGNRRSDVTLAMRHRLQWFIHLPAHSLRKGDEHPAYTPHRVWHSFNFTLYTNRPYTLPVVCSPGRYVALHYIHNL